MIDYQYFQLSNGLKVYIHEDSSTPLATVNLMYDVGSRDESPDKTGFAHLFEHLMFGGSQNVASFDEALQQVGGESNAFTSPDFTNYYVTLPAVNIETAFWLESDRMFGLNLSPEVLEVQRNVVIEEFKQRYLNQPYGDMWLRLRPLAYQVHPYNWATIGKDISHIEQASMQDVQAFYEQYYCPNNAVLVVAGGIKADKIIKLVEKWFGDIPAGKLQARKLPSEPPQRQARQQTVKAKVPLNAIYRAYHMGARLDADYYQNDLLSDVLGRGKSSRLYRQLVKEQKLFSNINAYVLGSADPGLILIQGNLNEDVKHEVGDAAIEQIIQDLQDNLIPEKELDKVKNKAESTLIFSEVEVLNRAVSLAFFATQGQPEQVNQESENIQAVSNEDIRTSAQQCLKPENCSTLYYYSN